MITDAFRGRESTSRLPRVGAGTCRSALRLAGAGAVELAAALVSADVLAAGGSATGVRASGVAVTTGGAAAR